MKPGSGRGHSPLKWTALESRPPLDPSVGRLSRGVPIVPAGAATRCVDNNNGSDAANSPYTNAVQPAEPPGGD